MALQYRGLTFAAAATASIGEDDFSKDGTGVGQLWEPATGLLCDYLQAAASSSLRGAHVLELGAGLGAPGLLCARLGAARVTLTDYHPLVLERLRASVLLNLGAASSAAVERFAWGGAPPHCGAQPLLLGADLGVSERAAELLAAGVKACLAPGGVFLYAHQERRAIVREGEGKFRREDTDSALERLVAALRPLHCRTFYSRRVEDGLGERVLLIGFGEAASLAGMPDWREPSQEDLKNGNAEGWHESIAKRPRHEQEQV
ncbi:hypothetical protein AB1Y20_005538 [Prymnesium parvum]|uniref:Calmodulin-lysine N-methyltransferase n=1 Tax=Prymnesium parvum TaxID=97485 RepID=A0AB34J6C4_PRYPA